MHPSLKRVLGKVRRSRTGRYLNMPLRLVRAMHYVLPQVFRVVNWTFTSREDVNYTYGLTDRNLSYLAHTLSIVSGQRYEQVLNFLREPLEDQRLIHHVEEKIKRGPDRHISDRRCSFGRRLGWYALVRAHKPKVVVETGVDKGLGAVLLCAALEKNALDGYPGRYQGTDINPAAGFLLSPPYNAFGEILYGDSIESLRRIPSIDLFINDSDHSSEYERREYEVIQPKLTERAIILGDNSHCTNELAEFSRNHKRVFLFFREEPADHWYPGAGIGISFIRDECP